MDKVKAQANALAQQANAGMEKVDSVPVKRKSDALLRSLGVDVLADRTGRGNPGAGQEIDRLIAEITQHEATNGIDLVQQAAQAAAQAQARVGPSPYLASSPSATDPNVSGTMPGSPGASPGYGYGDPGYGAPGSPGGPGYGDPNYGGPGGSGFQGAGQPGGFPAAGQPGGVPGRGPPGGPGGPGAGAPGGGPGGGPPPASGRAA